MSKSMPHLRFANCPASSSDETHPGAVADVESATTWFTFLRYKQLSTDVESGDRENLLKNNKDKPKNKMLGVVGNILSKRRNNKKAPLYQSQSVDPKSLSILDEQEQADLENEKMGRNILELIQHQKHENHWEKHIENIVVSKIKRYFHKDSSSEWNMEDCYEAPNFHG